MLTVIFQVLIDCFISLLYGLIHSIVEVYIGIDKCMSTNVKTTIFK
jgi:hypothetical protein